MATRKTASPAAKADAPAGDAAPETAAKPARIKAPSLKIKTLIDRVSETSGAKKKDVKEIVEATLQALGDALSKGEDLNLPGFGRTRVAKTAERDGASHMTLKVKRGPHRKKEAKEALADEEDDG